MSTDKPKTCCAEVVPRERWGAFNAHTCGKKAKVEVGGKHYCGIHDPAAVEARRVKSEAAWKARFESSPTMQLADLRAALARKDALLREAAVLVNQAAKADAVDCAHWDKLANRIAAELKDSK